MEAEVRGGPAHGQKFEVERGQTHVEVDVVVYGRVQHWRFPVTWWRKGPVLLWSTKERA